MGPVNAPVLKDMFGEDDGKEKGAAKFFAYARIGSGYQVKSVEIYNGKCGNCGHKMKVSTETEMDYKEETENHMARLCNDELEGR
jgi:hypothetical protein